MLETHDAAPGLDATRVRAGGLAEVNSERALVLAAPCALLVAGALVGYVFTLDEAVARERLIGLLVASGLAIAATGLVPRLRNADVLLGGLSVAALLAGGWVIAASGPEVFRGAVGNALEPLFRPLFGRAEVTDSVAVANTRFIVGYNGLADLCLVAIFGCAAVLLERPKPARAWALGLTAAIATILLVGTGARGGLTGLAAGVCAIGLYAWPPRFALLALPGAPAALALAAIGIFDKGLEFSSTAGRLTYWGDLARLLVEYPLTGVGLGVDTAYQVGLQYEINPDPERVFYAHNTFVQTYVEQGPLGFLGMLLLVAIVIAAALAARSHGVAAGQRTLLVAALGLVGGMQAHGLTDQVVTTNVGTAMVLLGSAAILAALSPAATRLVARTTARALVVVGVAAAVCAVLFVTRPEGRAQALLDLGALKMDAALALDPQATERAAALADAESALSLALGQSAEHPAILRDLALVRSQRFDDAGARQAIAAAAASAHLDAFDMLQIAHVYRELGFADEAYAWAASAYAAWGRPPEDAVMQVYAQSTLTDDRARVLAQQAEAAMRARKFGEAHGLFQRAVTFEPGSAYLADRLGASQRAIDKYGG